MMEHPVTFYMDTETTTHNYMSPLCYSLIAFTNPKYCLNPKSTQDYNAYTTKSVWMTKRELSNINLPMSLQVYISKDDKKRMEKCANNVIDFSIRDYNEKIEKITKQNAATTKLVSNLIRTVCNNNSKKFET